MKKFILLLIASGLLCLFTAQHSKAQKAKLIGSNALNGALTGAALGTSIMFMNDNADYSALRIGVGLGILGGSGAAVYDIMNLSSGQQPFIDGIFLDASNSSYIILFDTIYGAGFGAAIGSAAVVIGNRPIVKGLRYGAGIGAWVGFGFGLFDSFVYADRTSVLTSNRLLNSNSIFSLERESTTINVFQPDLISYQNLSGNTLSIDAEPILNVLSLQKRF
jgi:hypothetical protein